jgi:membrane-associated phospholipid phosphatase
MTQAFAALGHQLRTGDPVLALSAFLLISACMVVLVEWMSRKRIPGGGAYARFGWQLGALLGLEQAYEFTRGRIPHETDIAVLNAYRILDFEWRHGFFVEARIQRFFLQFHALMIGIDAFYMFAHLLVTIGVLTWVYVWRRRHYPQVRNVLMLTTAIALVVYYVYPTAPPRMLTNYGFVDPAVVLHHVAPAGGDQPDSFLYNPYAAMPSLHVGYALVVGLALFIAERRRWVRLFAVAYPLAMTAVVVISGNHWLLDVMGAVVTVALALAGVSGVSRLSAALRRGRRFEHERVRAPQSAEVPAT